MQQNDTVLWVESRSNNRFTLADEETGPESLPSLKEIITRLRGNKPGRLYLCGGEPTLRKDLPKVLQAGVQLGYECVLVTNGRMFSYAPFAQRIVKAGVHRVDVLLHSMDADIHNALVGDDAHAQTLAGIANLRKLGAIVIVHCAVTRDNASGLYDLVQYCATNRLGLHLVPASTAHPKADERVLPIAEVSSIAVETLQQARQAGLDDFRLSFERLPCCLTEALKGLERQPMRAVPAVLAGEPLVKPQPAPCLGCELYGECSVAPAGVVEMHGVSGLHAPGGLYGADFSLTESGSIDRFDIKACAADEQLPGPGPESAMVDRGDGAFEIWSAGDVAHPIELVACKNTHGLIREALEGGACQTLYLSPDCKGCLKLHRCGGIFSTAFDWVDETASYASTWMKRRLGQGGEAAPPVSLPTSQGHNLSRVENVAVWLQEKLDSMAAGETACVSARYPLAWLGPVPEQEHVPVVPWRVVDLLKEQSARMHSYDIGAARNHGVWTLTFERLEEVPPDWYYERLGTAFILSTCPASCVMCSVRKLYEDRLTPLPTVFRILEEFRLCGYTRIDYFGGEPTVRDDLDHIIHYATTLDCYSDIITNGMLMTPELAQRLGLAGLSLCMVSLDAPDAEHHDTIRGVPGGYDKAVQGLKNILEAPGVEVNIDTVILPQNYKIMHKQAELAAKLGATHVNFFFCVCGPIAAPKPMWLSAEQLTEFHQVVLPKIRETVEKEGITFTLSPDLPIDAEAAEAHIQRISSGTYNPFWDTDDICAGPVDEVYITLEGDVYPCTSPTILETEHVVGNIFEKSLIEVLSDAPMQEFMKVAGHVDACKMCFRCHIEPRIEQRFEDARIRLKERLRSKRT